MLSSLSEITGLAPYLLRPLIMLIVLGIVSGVVGVLVNLRALEFNAEALVHAVFPGIVAGAVYKGVDFIIPGASVVAIIAAIALTVVGRKKSSEAGTAVVLTSFYAIGIVISLYKGDMSGQLEALMFGRLLEVTDERLMQSILICLVALVLVTATWKEQVFFAFDRVAARATGIPVLAVDIAINAAIAAVVVAASTAVGVLLVIGYFVIPGAAARLVCRTVKGMVAVAMLIGVAGGVCGMWVMNWDTPRQISPQAAVALSIVAMYLLAAIVRNIMKATGHGPAISRGKRIEQAEAKTAADNAAAGVGVAGVAGVGVAGGVSGGVSGLGAALSDDATEGTSGRLKV